MDINEVTVSLVGNRKSHKSVLFPAVTEGYSVDVRCRHKCDKGVLGNGSPSKS